MFTALSCRIREATTSEEAFLIYFRIQQSHLKATKSTQHYIRNTTSRCPFHCTTINMAYNFQVQNLSTLPQAYISLRLRTLTAELTILYKKKKEDEEGYGVWV